MSEDMRQAIIPKSDQLNADDLIAGEMTIRITGVTIKGGQEQPVAISFDGDNGKPYKACKSMCRVMVAAWGPDSSKYVGRSMTLYRDPKVKWAGMEVGGIRISHMSDIPGDQVMALTVTRGSKKPYTVRPLVVDTGPDSESPRINAAQHKRLEARIGEVGIDREKVKKYVKKTFGKDHFPDMNQAEYDEIDKMLTDYRPKAKPQSGQSDATDALPQSDAEPVAPSATLKAAQTVEQLDAALAAIPDEDRDIYLAAYEARKAEIEGCGL